MTTTPHDRPSPTDPSMSRRRALAMGVGLGAGAAFTLLLGPSRLTGTSSASTPTAMTPIADPVVNPSFEDGPPGPTAPGWVFNRPTSGG